MKDHYAVLRVDRDASFMDIRSAYRSLAKVHHPDANLDDATAEEAFKRINEAHRVLRDPKRRERYDLELGISRGREFYAAPEPAGGTLVAVFGEGTPMQGMRIVRKHGELLLDGEEEMAAVAVLEFERLEQLVWASDAERGWVAAKATGARRDPGPPTSSKMAADSSPPRPPAPSYANAKGRDLVKKARQACQDSRFDAALKLLRDAEPSARLGDAEVARSITKIARAMRGRVFGPTRAECDELLVQVGGPQAEAAADAEAASRRPRRPRTGSPLSWLRRHSASRD